MIIRTCMGQFDCVLASAEGAGGQFIRFLVMPPAAADRATWTTAGWCLGRHSREPNGHGAFTRSLQRRWTVRSPRSFAATRKLGLRCDQTLVRGCRLQKGPT